MLRKWLPSVIAALALALSACAPGLQSTAPLSAAVGLEASPSGGSSFDFCVVPDERSELSLRDAAWLAFLSANEYSHAKVVGPTLNALGFGSPNEPMDASWEACSIDLRELRAAEAIKKDAIGLALGTPELRALARSLLPSDKGWGSCVGAYLNSDTLRVDVLPAAGFQEHLVRTVRPKSFLQFFSAGGISKDGTLFQDSSTQVLFARHRELPIAFIVFRGTEPSQRADVVVDLKLWQTKLSEHGWPEGWGSVHSGFVGAFESVEPLVTQKVRELSGTGVRVFVTGHSLGGALATLMTAHLLRLKEEGLDIDVAASYTFGSPRVGNSKFADAFTAATERHNVQVVRVRNGSDVVTSLPGLVLDYEHVGTLALLQEGSLTVPRAEPEYGSPSTADHSSSGFDVNGAPVSGYYRRLRDVLKAGAFPELDKCSTK